MNWNDPEQVRQYNRERSIARANGDIRRRGRKAVVLSEEEIQKKKDAIREYNTAFKRKKREQMTPEEREKEKERNRVNLKKYRERLKQREIEIMEILKRNEPNN